MSLYGTLSFIQNWGILEWGMIALVALIFFGNRLPDVARSLAKSVVNFKKGIREAEAEIKNVGEKEGPSPYVDDSAVNENDEGSAAEKPEEQDGSSEPK